MHFLEDGCLSCDGHRFYDEELVGGGKSRDRTSIIKTRLIFKINGYLNMGLQKYYLEYHKADRFIANLRNLDCSILEWESPELATEIPINWQPHGCVLLITRDGCRIFVILNDSNNGFDINVIKDKGDRKNINIIKENIISLLDDPRNK